MVLTVIRFNEPFALTSCVLAIGHSSPEVSQHAVPLLSRTVSRPLRFGKPRRLNRLGRLILEMDIRNGADYLKATTPG
jgi:hypothetical protein